MGNMTKRGVKLPPGPWIDEPDKLHWIDEASDLDCLIVRNPVGALCGYVGVPNGHPFHGVDYDDVPVSVHGGLTFANKCQEGEEAREHGICHVPAPGRDPDVWWLGFDCAHAGDLCPGMIDYLSPRYREVFGGDTYRDLDYVRNEVTQLAAQLALFGGIREDLLLENDA